MSNSRNTLNRKIAEQRRIIKRLKQENADLKIVIKALRDGIINILKK